MVEFALKIECIEEFNGVSLCDYLNNDEIIALKALGNSITDSLTDMDIKYLYFGNEFCENNIPPMDEIKKFIDICTIYKLSAVFVTPPVTDFGIEKLNKCLKIFADAKINLNVVVNDVGVLDWIHENFPDFNLIIGRLFDQSNRESRVSREMLEKYYGDSGLLYAKTPAVYSSEFTSIFRKMTSCRLSTDISQIDNETVSADWKIDLYWPYTYITTGRSCLWKNSFIPQSRRFLVDNKCNRYCYGKYAVLRDESKNILLYQKGNTIFHKVSIDELLVHINRDTRVVIQMI